jgi:hypothetical protein
MAATTRQELNKPVAKYPFDYQRQQMTGPPSSISSESRTLRRFGSPSIRNPAWGGAI